MSNQQPEVLVANQQPEEQENFSIVDEEIQLRNSRGRKKVFSPYSTSSSNSSSIASSAPDDDDVTVINDQTDEEGEPGENTEFLATEPGQLILNHLLRDSHISTSGIVFQPIQYILIRVRSRLEKRKDFTCSNVNMIACLICLQHFQKLHSHRKHDDDPLGCHNIARIHDYLCLRKGIPLPPHLSRQLRVHLYEDFNSFESLIMNLNQTFLLKDPGRLYSNNLPNQKSD